MEKNCYKCNAAVPVGNPFCGQCGAAQIRVNISPEPSVIAAPDLNSEQMESTKPVAGQEAPYQHGTQIAWSSALPKAAIAGFATLFLLEGLGAVLPGGLALLFGIPLGGAFAVWLYQRNRNEAPIDASMGAKVGAVTGLFAFVVMAIVSGAYFRSQRGAFSEAMQQAMGESLKRDPSPQAQLLAQKMMTPEGIATIVTLGAIIGLIVFLLLCSAGGSIGAVLMQRQQRGE